MSVLQKKIRNYLDQKRGLDRQYQLVVKSVADSAGLRDLYEFDQLCYSYVALKSYYDNSRTNWDSDYRNLLDDLANIVSRMEDKIPVADILGQVPELSVIRRSLKENAREGGKVAFSMVSSNFEMDRFRRMIMELGVDAIEVNSDSSRQTSRAATTPVKEAEKARTPVEVENGAGSAGKVSVEKTVSSSTQKNTPNNQTATSQTRFAQNPAAQKAATASTPLAHSSASHTPATPAFASQKQPSPALQNETRPTVFVRSGKSPVPSRGGISSSSGQAAISLGAQTSSPVSKPSSHNWASKPGSKGLSTSDLGTSTSSIGQKRPSPTPSGSSPNKRSKQVFFAHFNTWNEEYVRCIYNCATIYPHRVAESIQEAFALKFGLKLSPEAVHALQSHYGILPETMAKYQYYIQAFHSVASQFYKNRHKYVTEPWAELKRSFLRKTDFTLSDDDVKGRYELFVLHRQTYSDRGEPPSNYEPHWEAFHRVYTFRKSQKASNSSFFASAHTAPKPPRVFSPAPPEEPSNGPTQSFEWTPRRRDVLIEAQAFTPNDEPDRILAIQKRLARDGIEVPLEEIISKSGTTYVMQKVLELRRETREKAEKAEKAHTAQNQAIGANISQAQPSKHSDAGGLKTPTKPQSEVQATEKSSSEKSSSIQHILNKPHTPQATQQKPSSPNSKPSAPVVDLTKPKTGTFKVQVINEKSMKTPKKPAYGAPSKKSPAQTPTKNYFESLMQDIALQTRIDAYYRVRFKNLEESEFWDFEKHKTITATVEHISRIPENTTSPAEQVARANLLKLITVRVLRLHHILMKEDYLEQKLIKMMKEEVFDAKACQLINDQIANK